jgi:hypothetical protein
VSVETIREWIRDRVREQHATNGGEVNTKGIASEVPYLVADDPDGAAAAISEEWGRKVAQREAATVRSQAKSARGHLIPNGEGVYSPASQMTLFELGIYAARQQKAGQTVAMLATRVLEIVAAASSAGADLSQRPEDVLSVDEMDAVYSLTNEVAA